jgi:hypothetical protein
LYKQIQSIFKKNEYEWDYKYDWVISPAVNTETSTKMLVNANETSKFPIHFNANKEEDKQNLVIEKGMKKEHKQERAELPVIIMEE